jgi:hypothetical protein
MAKFPSLRRRWRGVPLGGPLQAHSCLIDGEAVAPLKKIPPAGERGGIVGGPTRGEGQVHRVAPT